MKFNFHSAYWKKLLVNLGIMVGITTLILLVFFYWFLPSFTNHGETITVPDLLGINFEEIDDFLTSRNLRYEVLEDSSFNPDEPPLTILKQFPLPHSKVKEKRKIYLTLNMRQPPMVKMPLLVDRSLKNAQLQLKSVDLYLGQIKYVPNRYANLVLEQWYEGKPIEEGLEVSKGSSIDLVVGDGAGKQDFETPNLVGLDLEDAEFAIIGSGLKVGYIFYEEESPDFSFPEGFVFKQRPEAEDKIRIGDNVDLWVVKPKEENEDETPDERKASLDQDQE